MGLFGDKRHRANRPSDKPLAEDVLPGYMTGKAPSDKLDSQPRGVNLSKAARVTLKKYPKLARPWAVYSAIDVSYSMDEYIGDGSLDYLTEAICAACYEGGWDSDNKVPAFPYGKTVAPEPYTLELGASRGSGQAIRSHAGSQGVNRAGTYFCPPVMSISQHYKKSSDWGFRPALAFIQTDGINADHDRLSRLLAQASALPIHWVFIYYGFVDPSGQGIDNAANLRKLDNGIGMGMEQRIVDNVSIFIAGPKPKRVTEEELMEGLMAGPNQWVSDAIDAGLLP